MKPTPINRPGDRNALCPHYDDCLDQAARRYWLHFDCSECVHRSEKKTVPHGSASLGLAFDTGVVQSALDWV